MTAHLRRPRVPERGWLAVFLAFARIGATSFGGGSATIAAMRQTCLRRGWLSGDAFLDTVVVSRLTPGITILAQALLIGRAIAGVAGMIAAVAGMLGPAITITVALAWLYTGVADLPGAARPLAAVAAVAAGFAVAVAVQLMRDVLRRGNVPRGLLLYAAFVLMATTVSNPLFLLGTAVLAGLLVPRLFVTRDDETAGAPTRERPDPDRPDREGDTSGDVD